MPEGRCPLAGVVKCTDTVPYANVREETGNSYLMPGAVAIPDHGIRFRAVRVKGHKWDPVEGEYKAFDHSLANGDKLDGYASFASSVNAYAYPSLTVSTDNSGKAVAWMTSNSTRDVVIREIEYEAADSSVWEIASP